MQSSRKIRKLLNDLIAAGLFIDYSLRLTNGQSVMVYDEYRKPRLVRLGTAQQILNLYKKRGGAKNGCTQSLQKVWQ